MVRQWVVSVVGALALLVALTVGAGAQDNAAAFCAAQWREPSRVGPRGSALGSSLTPARYYSASDTPVRGRSLNDEPTGDTGIAASGFSTRTGKPLLRTGLPLG